MKITHLNRGKAPAKTPHLGVHLVLHNQITIRTVRLDLPVPVDPRDRGDQKATPAAPVQKAISAIQDRKALLDLWEPRGPEDLKDPKGIRVQRVIPAARDRLVLVGRRDR